MRHPHRSLLLASSAFALLALATACTPVVVPPPPKAPPAAAPPLRTGDQNGSLGTCSVFPADNPWNTDVSDPTVWPARLDSAQIIGQIQADGADFLHADFGGSGAYGIPYVTVPPNEPNVPINFVDWPEQSDPGPYPVPLGAPVEGGSDRHVIAVQRGSCKLYELFNAKRVGTTRWDASSGAVFDLSSNALRPDGWTSADAAGLPIFAGLVRYDEIASGAIDHALRVTFDKTRRGYIHPATHDASSSTNPYRPPMGMRLRLSAGYDVSGYTGQARVVLDALKRYGLLVADNGSNWYITGAADSRWDDTDLDQLKSVPGTAFEVVDTGEPVTS